MFRAALLSDRECSILVGLLLWNYRLCVITDPGGVPSTWVRALLGPEEHHVNLEPPATRRQRR